MNRFLSSFAVAVGGGCLFTVSAFAMQHTANANANVNGGDAAQNANWNSGRPGNPVTPVNRNMNGTAGSLSGNTDGGASGRVIVHEMWRKPATRWQKATDLVGKPVKNEQGESLGEIGNLAIDPDQGRVIYGVLEFGGFMGLGEKNFAIPWSALKLAPNYEHVVLGVDKGRLEVARGFDKGGQWPNFGDLRWAEETYNYYGQPPYWGNDADGRVYKPTARWQKSTDLIGKNVRNQAEAVGEIDDLVVDPDSGRVMYGVVDFGDWMSGEELYAIPWRAMDLSPDYAHFTLNMTRDPLKQAPHFSNNNWPNLADQTMAREVHMFYSVPVYWEDDSRAPDERMSGNMDQNRKGAGGMNRNGNMGGGNANGNVNMNGNRNGNMNADNRNRNNNMNWNSNGNRNENSNRNGTP